MPASNPDLGRDIRSANQAEVLKQTSHFRAALDDFEKAIQNNDLQALRRLIDQASQVRSGWALQTGSEEHDD